MEPIVRWTALHLWRTITLNPLLWALQSWSQQHNDRDGSPLLSSDGARITLDPLLDGAYRNTGGLSSPGLSSTTMGRLSTSLLRWRTHYLDPLLDGAYRNTGGLSSPGLSSTTMGTVLISALLKDTGGEQQYKVSQEKPKGTPRFNIYYPIPNIPP